jgi:hypothetical protein
MDQSSQNKSRNTTKAMSFGKKMRHLMKVPNPKFGRFLESLTVVDSKGQIVFWYLPDLLSEEVEVGFFSLFSMLTDSGAIGWSLQSYGWNSAIS